MSTALLDWPTLLRTAFPRQDRAKVIARAAGGITPRAAEHWLSGTREPGWGAIQSLARHNDRVRERVLRAIAEDAGCD